jgi:hypothetical protein
MTEGVFIGVSVIEIVGLGVIVAGVVGVSVEDKGVIVNVILTITVSIAFSATVCVGGRPTKDVITLTVIPPIASIKTKRNATIIFCEDDRFFCFERRRGVEEVR